MDSPYSTLTNCHLFFQTEILKWWTKHNSWSFAVTPQPTLRNSVTSKDARILPPARKSVFCRNGVASVPRQRTPVGLARPQNGALHSDATCTPKALLPMLPTQPPLWFQLTDWVVHRNWGKHCCWLIIKAITKDREERVQELKLRRSRMGRSAHPLQVHTLWEAPSVQLSGSCPKFVLLGFWEVTARAGLLTDGVWKHRKACPTGFFSLLSCRV